MDPTKSHMRLVESVEHGDRELLIRPTELSGDVQDHFWSDGTIITPWYQAEIFLRLPC